ncbi:MAG TPA: DUF3108 domain-containing protein [Cyclobacteriaceae bacterium]|nr:DUF3108 domain-containing protein [Cyclobacteriaceae bacterium]
MRRFIFWLFASCILSAFTTDRKEIYPVVKNDSFIKGEYVEYKMSYGIFTVGKGSTRIDKQYYRVNNRDCFKVDVFGRTVGMVDWVADVNDQWGAYVDTSAILPHVSYRKIREGNYKKDEIINFDHVKGKIEAKVFNHKEGKFKEPQYYDAQPHVRDMISGFMYLRLQDLSKVKVGDTVIISGFFEDKTYRMKVVYKGKEVVKTKAGKIKCLVFKPDMPENSLFKGKDSITAWFSDDKNRIPIKVSADMFIGSAGVEITSYKGLRNPVNLVK